MTTQPLVTASVVGAIGRLHLNRAAARNAINHEMVAHAEAGVQQLREQGVRVAVLSAEAPVFCAGNDLSEAQTPEQMLDSAVFQLVDVLIGAPILWIAQLEGAVIGGGLAVIASCPLVIAEQSVWFALPEVTMSLFPAGVMPYLEPVIGARAAFDMALTGRRVAAERAYELGLVTEILPQGEVAARAEELAGVLSEHPAAAAAAQQLWRSGFATTSPGRRSQLDDALRDNVAAMTSDQG